MKKLESALAVSFLLGIGACASGPPLPPPELTNARTEVAKAKQGPANQLAPTDVHEASEALDKAESSFADKPYSADTVDLAASAKLKAEAAQTKAAAIQAHAQKEQAERAYESAQAAHIQAQQQALALEQQRVAELEQKESAACAVMGRVAVVKRAPSGTIVTFQSDPLFQFNKSDLKPEATSKLDAISEQLKTGFEGHKIHVNGYTDAVGGAGPGNQALSDKRAEAVKNYLISKGIKDDMIDSSGHGPADPVASNANDAGRTLNRRVEIVIEPDVTRK